MNYLIVVAHPDDEVLGAGATIFKLIMQGNKVAVAIMSGHAAARNNRSATLSEDEEKAMSIMGVEKVYHADFPNIKMNTSDTNIDHQETSRAAVAACRLFQRKEGIPQLRELSYMEVPSSTEWSLNSAENRFTPNKFVEIGKSGVEKKLEALSAYTGVMRPYPHPRSVEALTGLAASRGAQAGCAYAEAFESVFRSE